MDEITAVVDTPALQAPISIDELKPKMKLTGRVERLELYGAFIDIGVGVNALIHISQLGEERVNRVSDVLKVGDEIPVWVDKVNPEAQQIMVTMIKPLAVDWSDLKTGQVYTGKVTRLETFGAFIDIGAEREGLVHISELSHDYVKHPSEVAKVEDEVQVQVLGFSKRKRRIDLSMKALMEKPEPPEEVYTAPRSSRKQQRVEEVVDFEEDEDEEMPTAMEIALRRAMGDDKIDELTPTGRRGKRSGRKRQNERNRRQQEDLLSRTLQMQD
jgi:ribosomal protein S1